jgi:exodeoxyribonuclease III
LKIATFNINNINKRLHNLTAWLARAQPDVVCLQELKVEQRAFPASALRDLGYRGVWLGERSWNGVAILARECDPVLTRSSLPGNPDDHQARYIEAAVDGVLITSIYLPGSVVANREERSRLTMQDTYVSVIRRPSEQGVRLMNTTSPATSPFGNHLTCPFRIICITS